MSKKPGRITHLYGHQAELQEAFAEMRAAAVPGDCERCGAKQVPCITLTREGDESQKKVACIKCLTGENDERKEPVHLN